MAGAAGKGEGGAGGGIPTYSRSPCGCSSGSTLCFSPYYILSVFGRGINKSSVRCRGNLRKKWRTSTVINTRSMRLLCTVDYI